MPNVAFTRLDIAKLLPQYYLIRDCLGGETTIKDARDKYLPKPDPTDTSAENKERYKAYLRRAVFYNVTRRTLSGLIGQVFMRDPIVKLPPAMDSVQKDTTGTGVDLTQQAKKSLSLTLAYSRSGLLVDYPETNGVVTKAQIESGEIRPTISSYSPQEIINWRVLEKGAREILSLVVLAETFPLADDGFEIKQKGQFRVLRLDAITGNYVIEIWREPIPNDADGTAIPKGNFVVHSIINPTGFDGLPLKEIPFSFIGSENNDSYPDNPNMYDLASINVAHYRNSADYEEACYMLGQPTVVMTGLTEEWLNNVLKNKVNFGSRGGIPLPTGATAELLQAKENTMMKEAMETKERQMVALGAKLVEQKQVQRTAFETKVEATSEGSILSSTTKNVASAYLWALKWCARLMGQDENAVEFELNTDFDIARMTPEEVKQTILNWQSGAITFGEMRDVLRKAGQATVDDAIAKAEIEADTVKAMALEMPANTPSGNAPPANNSKPVGGA